MNRKNTILLAVLINAGLLLILFITALTSQEEIAIAPTHEMSSAASSQSQEASPPLFGEEIDFAMRSPAKTLQQETLPQVLPEAPIAKQAEAPVVHALPPLASTPTHQEIPVVAAQALQTPVRTPDGFQEVTVKKGDTLEKIAKAHRTTVDEIIRVNQLPSSFLRVGQVLKLPAEKAPLAKAPVKPATAEKNIEEGPEYYTVKVGDNPWSIAMKHHLKVEELLKLNGLNEEKARKLKPGDRLRIR